MIVWGLVASLVLWLICVAIHELWLKHRWSRRMENNLRKQMELTKIAMGAEMILAVAPLLQAMDLALKELEELEGNE